MKTTLKPNKRYSLKAGFSLVELLVVIAVIGIIAAIAIPNISSITGAAGTATLQRNAQTVASVFSSARAAGYSGSIDTEAEAIDAVVAGVTGQGTFAGQTFQATVGPTDVAALKADTTTLLNLVGTGATSTLNYTKP